MTQPVAIRLFRGAPPLLELLARDLCAKAGFTILEDRTSPESGALRFDALSGERACSGRLALEDDPSKAALEIGGRTESLDVALVSGHRDLATRRRVLLALDAPGERRMKMAARIAAEARRRGLRHTIAVAGSVASDVLRAVGPDEVFPELDAEEVRSLLEASAFCVDPSHADEAPSPVAMAAAALGTPVLVAPGTRLAERELTSVIPVAGQYPDAYCDVIAAGANSRSSREVDIDVVAVRFKEAVQRAFGS